MSVPLLSLVIVFVPLPSLSESGAPREVPERLSTRGTCDGRRRIRWGASQLHVDVFDREGDQGIGAPEKSRVEERINSDANPGTDVVERATACVRRCLKFQFRDRDGYFGSGCAVRPQHSAFDATLCRSIRGDQ